MERRRLSFNSFDDALAEVDRLIGCDCTRAGNWDLSQVIDHLADGLEGTMRGFEYRAPWLLQNTVGKLGLHYILWRRFIPVRAKMPPRFEPLPGKDATACAARLRQVVANFRAWDKPLAMHPFFGWISDDQWRRLQVIHMAHHLGYIVPTVKADTAPA